MRPTQLAHQNRQYGRCAMTKARAKTNAIRMPGKERPAASRLAIQQPPTTKPHHRNLCRNTKTPVGQPIGQTAEGLDYRFLRSQPRVIGSGSLRKARPRQSEYQFNTEPKTPYSDGWSSLRYYLRQGSNRHGKQQACCRRSGASFR